MNAEELLDHALGQVDDLSRVRFEERLAQDPELAGRYARLRDQLHELLDDGTDLQPPAGLAYRTIRHVEVNHRRGAPMELAPPRSAFRWADLAVAATIFFVAILTLAAPLQHSRMAARLVGCGNHLREIGTALIHYDQMHPARSGLRTLDNPAMPLINVSDAGLLPDASVLDCPLNGPNPALAGPADHHLSGSDLPSWFDENEYAVPYGYRNGGEHPVLPSPTAYDPILADLPPRDARGHVIDRGNSPNHYGQGQHVLLGDGHVIHLRTRGLHPDSDIYRNQYGQTAPGTRRNDYVLGVPVRDFP